MALQAQVHPLQERFTRTVGVCGKYTQLVNQNIKPTNQLGTTWGESM